MFRFPPKKKSTSPKPKRPPGRTCGVLPRTGKPSPFWPLLPLLLLTHPLTPPPPPSWAGGSVAVVVRFEGPLGGQAQVLGLLVGQFGQLHSQFVQVSSCHLLVQLYREKTTNRTKFSLRFNSLSPSTTCKDDILLFPCLLHTTWVHNSDLSHCVFSLNFTRLSVAVVSTINLKV